MPDVHRVLLTIDLRDAGLSTSGDYRNFYASVRDAINGVAPLAVPTEEGYRVVKLLELARESSVLQRTLPVAF